MPRPLSYEWVPHNNLVLETTFSSDVVELIVFLITQWPSGWGPVGDGRLFKAGRLFEKKNGTLLCHVDLSQLNCTIFRIQKTYLFLILYVKIRF